MDPRSVTQSWPPSMFATTEPSTGIPTTSSYLFGIPSDHQGYGSDELSHATSSQTLPVHFYPSVPTIQEEVSGESAADEEEIPHIPTTHDDERLSNNEEYTVEDDGDEPYSNVGDRASSAPEVFDIAENEDQLPGRVITVDNAATVIPGIVQETRVRISQELHGPWN
jgi:hypothetical protein